MAIDRKRIALIHVAKSHLALAEDDYRDILRHVAGVDSSTELDDVGFELVMAHFTRLGFKSDYRTRGFGFRPGMASEKQVEYIRGLWRDYTGDKGTDATLGRWLDRTFGVAALRFVTADQAPRVITALKRMNDRKAA